ncbi:MAG TPA: sugar ABC transporter ATP-binding protein [Cerasibacillus sp.]|uniref:sugar ABC transporter ATP-binding protein n=1 Tax=Cerasibacillus sp. TaxID=2498711 RepID=UPI002F42370E
MKAVELKMNNINIEFPGVHALKGVDFTLKSGTINALIGANGAGKSTLMKILSGSYSHYTGEITLNDKPATIRNPKQAKNLGIDIVHQEVDIALVPYLTVAENILLDKIANNMENRHRIKWKEIHQEAKEVLLQLDIHLPTHRLISELTLADKQMVLIARSLINKPKFLILDEPTAPLSDTETEKLFFTIRKLQNEFNIGIVFISHRLPELFEICENITVMRDGLIVSNTKIKNTTIDEIVKDMLGDESTHLYVKKEKTIGNTTLQVTDLTNHDLSIKNISLHINSGEIVGIAGLVGAGKTELCKTLFGDFPIKSGTIQINEEIQKYKNTAQAVNKGIALVPEERRKEGIFVDEPVYKNFTISHLKNFSSRFNILSQKKEREISKEMIAKLGVKTPNELQNIGLLSGGNQQKVAVGKWLISPAHVYIFDEPTKGIDIGAKAEMFELIDQLASEGKAVLYASSELQEILTITDRIYIMYDNKIVKEVLTKDTSEEEIMFFSTGGTK